MSFVDPEPEGKPLFHEPTYVDEATRRRRLIPSLILAIPMIVAFVVLTWTQGGMIEWAVSRPRLADGAYHATYTAARSELVGLVEGRSLTKLAERLHGSTG